MLSELQSWLAELLEAHPLPLLALNRAGQCVYLNAASLSFVAGLRAQDQPEDLEHDALYDWLLENLNLARNVQSDAEFLLELSGLQAEEVVCSKVCEASDFTILAMRDNSEADLSEGNLHRLRLETLGTLAGGIAHDFNNLLAGILGHITYLETILPARGEHSESIAAISEGAKKATSMTQQILDFAKSQSSSEVRSVDLCNLIKRTSLLLKGALRAAQSLEIRVVSDSPVMVEADEGKLAQVLVNLVINARDAIDDKGVIEIRCGCHAGDEAFVCVSDTGEGISQQNLKKVFQPFFSTKGAAGTGLGLATSRSIMEEFGGKISIESRVGEGTSVSLFMPLVRDFAEEERDESKVEPVRGNGELIVVVDDEPPVRNVLRMSLSHLGYEVEVFDGAADALEFAKSNCDRLGLVVLDMLMPGISGEEAFFQLREIRDDLRVLIMSGYSSRKSIENVLGAGACGFIQKPFTIEDLSTKVSASLE